MKWQASKQAVAFLKKSSAKDFYDAAAVLVTRQ